MSRNAPPIGRAFSRGALVDVAARECERLSGSKRGEPLLDEAIARYCRDLAVDPGADLRGFHYSAVFVSWCMRRAGAAEDVFPACVAHWQYAKRALLAADTGSGLLQARPIETYAPVPGDLLHLNRDGGRLTLERVAQLPRYLSEGGIVTAIDRTRGTLAYVIANVPPTGSVGRQTLDVDRDGLIRQRAVDPVICILESPPGAALARTSP